MHAFMRDREIQSENRSDEGNAQSAHSGIATHEFHTQPNMSNIFKSQQIQSDIVGKCI